MINLYEQQQLIRKQQEEMRKLQKLQQQAADGDWGHSLQSQSAKIPHEIEIGDHPIMMEKKRAMEYTSESDNKRQK